MAEPIDPRCKGATREILVVDVTRRGATALVQPRGELDIATVERLRAALDEFGAPGRLVLDLRGLSFIDSTGLHLLTELHERATRDRFELRLVAPRAPADRSIRVCGLDRHLPFVADLPTDGFAA